VGTNARARSRVARDARRRRSRPSRREMRSCANPGDPNPHSNLQPQLQL
jgi:hypothetical protein